MSITIYKEKDMIELILLIIFILFLSNPDLTIGLIWYGSIVLACLTFLGFMAYGLFLGVVIFIL